MSSTTVLSAPDRIIITEYLRRLGELAPFRTKPEQLALLKHLQSAIWQAEESNHQPPSPPKLVISFHNDWTSQRGGQPSLGVWDKHPGRSLYKSLKKTLGDLNNRDNLPYEIELKTKPLRIRVQPRSGFVPRPGEAEIWETFYKSSESATIIEEEVKYQINDRELGPVFGRDAEIERLRERGLADPCQPLLIFGPPGIGKSTLARSILRDTLIKKRFRGRRFELQCDNLRTADGFKIAMGNVWFDYKGPDAETIFKKVKRELEKQPSAVLIDNFETLAKSGTPDVRIESQKALADLARLSNVWLITGVMGHEPPAQHFGLIWPEPHRPDRLERKWARELFCLSSENRHHPNDPALDTLLQDLDYVPHAIQLVAFRAKRSESLKSIQELWRAKKTSMLRNRRRQDRLENIEVSYEIAISDLDRPSFRALRMLASVPAGMSKAAFKELTGGDDALDIALDLAALVEHDDTPPRRRMLKPLRDYVHMKYPATRSDSNRLITHYLSLAAKGNESNGLRASKIVDDLAIEVPNLVWALEADLAGDRERIMPALSGLARFSAITGLASLESIALLQERFDFTNDARDRAACARDLGNIYRLQDHCQKAQEFFELALSLFVDIPDTLHDQAYCQRWLGDVACELKDLSSRSWYQKAADLFRVLGDKGGEAWCIRGMGEAEREFQHDAHHLTEAERQYQEALPLFEDARSQEGDRGELMRGQAWCWLGLGEIARLRDKYSEAQSFYERARPMFKAAGDKRSEAWCLWCSGEVAFKQGLYGQAHTQYEKAKDDFHSCGTQRGEAWCLQGLARLAYQTIDIMKARKLYTQALHMFQSVEDSRGTTECEQALNDLKSAKLLDLIMGQQDRIITDGYAQSAEQALGATAT